MWLRGIKFRPVTNASGARGFFQEGYWYHYPWTLAGMTWNNTGFVAKTVTLEPRLSPEKNLGNMPLLENGFTPKEFFPSCIVPKVRSGVVLNAVGLSNPGAFETLRRGWWQQIFPGPFHISFMATQKERSDRLVQLREFITLLKQCLPQFASRLGLEMNFSCPNASVNPSSLVQEIGEALDIAGELPIPLQIKINALAPVRAICETATHPSCHAITMGNTLPWGSMPDIIPWQSLFKSPTSPLAHLGGGGISGPPLCPIHCEWIASARDFGFTKPIWGCGGIDSVQAVNKYKAAGASGIQLGTVCMLRPWRMRSIIQYANSVFT